jgi:hypothetical protein
MLAIIVETMIIRFMFNLFALILRVQRYEFFFRLKPVREEKHAS